MIDFPVLAIGFIWHVIAVLFVICCIALILIILVQKGKGGGLSSAFGGGMSGGILGSKTGDFLTWVTIVLVCIMLFFAILLAKFYRPDISGTGTTGQTNSGSSTSSDSPISMIEESDIVETDTPDEGILNTEETTNETSDTNQTDN